MLQIGPELGVVHGSLLLLARLLLLPLGQHPRHLRAGHTGGQRSELGLVIEAAGLPYRWSRVG